MPGPCAESPKTPASSSSHRAQGQGWGDSSLYLEGRRFWGSKELSFFSCCQIGWGCSPEIPRGKARRPAPPVSLGGVH